MPLKIAIAVHGRFHAFDLARALLTRGHDVTLYTNYPRWAAKKFGITADHVQSFPLHGVLARANNQLRERMPPLYREAWLHQLYGKWAASALAKQTWDAILCWSGVAEEILDTSMGRSTPCILTRGSAHIRVQAQLLADEETRTKSPQDRPSGWIIQREEREYTKAQYIRVLSTFARKTFEEMGVPSKKIVVTPLGVELKAFRPEPSVIQARCHRLLARQPLRIIYVGTLSYRKGMWDFCTIARQLKNDNFKFLAVGPITQEVEEYIAPLRSFVEFIPKQPHYELIKQYADGDIFLFPSIEDGFAAVLAQASAGGLPIIATTNCAAPDFVREGESGWIVPIRSPETIIERLQWCEIHREAVADMVQKIYADFSPYTWNDAASKLEQVILNL